MPGGTVNDTQALIPWGQVEADRIKRPMVGGPCTECGREREDFPMCFRGEPQCCVNCKKSAK